LYDFARGLATHANIRKPETFHPHGGRLLEPTEENIQLANSGQIKVNLPLLLTEKSVPEDHLIIMPNMIISMRLILRMPGIPCVSGTGPGVVWLAQ